MAKLTKIQQEKAAKVAELERLTNQMPDGWSGWGVVRTREWRTCVERSRTVAHAKRSSRNDLTHAINNLLAFWPEQQAA